MTRKEFFECGFDVYVTESDIWINYPDIYGIVIQGKNFIAYKNPSIGEKNTDATSWAVSTETIEDAYSLIAKHIKQHQKIKTLKK